MEGVPTSSFEQPLDLSARTTLPAPSLFQSNYLLPYNLVSPQIAPLIYPASQRYSPAMVPARLPENLADSSWGKPVSLVSPMVEPESSTTPKKCRKNPIVSSVVDKSSMEYRKKRLKNNEAARKSRQKKKETEVEQKRILSDLQDEIALLRESKKYYHFLLTQGKCVSCSRPLSDGLFRYDNRIPTIGIGDVPPHSQHREQAYGIKH